MHSGKTEQATNNTNKDVRQILNVDCNAFYFQINCNSMENAGIVSGDVVIAEKAESCDNGSVVIAEIDGQLLIRRYQIIHNRLYLIPETSGLSVVEFPGVSMCKIIGVVKAVIHKM